MDRITWLFDGHVEPAESVRRDLAWMRRAAALGPVADPIIRFWRAPRECILLGRYRRISDSLLVAQEIVGARRLGGGRAVLSGPGFLNMSLVMPEARELTDRRGAGPVPIPTEKILNRYVRGLLGGLTALGVRAFYPGREWVTAGGRRLASLSFDLDDTGVCLFEAVIAVEGNAGRGDPLLASHGIVYQSGPGSPINVTTVSGAARSSSEISAERLAESIAAGYGARFGLEVVRLESVPADLPGIEPLDVTWLTSRSPRDAQDHRAATETPSGPIEAMLGVTPDLRLTHVMVAGDFLANAPAVARYEKELEGCPARWHEIGLITDRVFSTPPNTILGLSDLKILPDTIMNAASAEMK